MVHHIDSYHSSYTLLLVESLEVKSTIFKTVDLVLSCQTVKGSGWFGMTRLLNLMGKFDFDRSNSGDVDVASGGDPLRRGALTGTDAAGKP